MAVAQIDCDIDEEGRVYPFGGDTPIPHAAILHLDHKLQVDVAIGDIVVEANGRAWLITEESDNLSIWRWYARAVDKPKKKKAIKELEMPLIRVYHQGEPRHDWFS